MGGGTAFTTVKSYSREDVSNFKILGTKKSELFLY